ncbi:MAG: DUF4347 domain-containing protein, partial [Betaproteobacteria bacterium]
MNRVNEQTVSAAQQARHEIVFVDTATPDYEALLEDIHTHASQSWQIDVRLLDSDSDGIEQITRGLSAETGISAIHLISHGSDGAIGIAGTRLDIDSLLQHTTQIKGWANSLSPDAEILIYGCNVAKGTDGKALINALSSLTGAHVAASEDVTGGVAQGGDWDLEYQTGAIGTPVIVSVLEQHNWDHLLEDAPLDAAAGLPATVATPGAPLAAATTPSESQVQVSVGTLPLTFEQNVGQAQQQFDFISRGSDYAVGLDQGNATIAADNGAATSVVHLNLVGKNAGVGAQAEGLLQSKTNYLVGSADQWHQDIANYSAVRYDNVYDGIDLRYYGTQRQLEYDFVVNPGARVDAIQLHFDGAQSVTLADNGDLVLTLDSSGYAISFQAPVAYQNGPGGREAVASHYVIAADGTVHFETAAFDGTRALVIDPVLSYATYFGGSRIDVANGIAVDSGGNVYLAGYTDSTGLLGGLLGAGNGQDVFVTKLSPDLRNVLYSTYIGGRSEDRAMAI